MQASFWELHNVKRDPFLYHQTWGCSVFDEPEGSKPMYGPFLSREVGTWIKAQARGKP